MDAQSLLPQRTLPNGLIRSVSPLSELVAHCTSAEVTPGYPS
jgi:hypothetical protein